MTEDLRARIHMSETQISRLTDIVSRVEETNHKVVGALVGIKDVLQEQKDAHKEFREDSQKMWESVSQINIALERHSNCIATLMESRGWMLGGIGFLVLSVIGAVIALVVK